MSNQVGDEGYQDEGGTYVFPLGEVDDPERYSRIDSGVLMHKVLAMSPGPRQNQLLVKMDALRTKSIEFCKKTLSKGNTMEWIKDVEEHIRRDLNYQTRADDDDDLLVMLKWVNLAFFGGLLFELWQLALEASLEVNTVPLLHDKIQIRYGSENEITEDTLGYCSSSLVTHAGFERYNIFLVVIIHEMLRDLAYDTEGKYVYRNGTRIVRDAFDAVLQTIEHECLHAFQDLTYSLFGRTTCQYSDEHHSVAFKRLAFALFGFNSTTASGFTTLVRPENVALPSRTKFGMLGTGKIGKEVYIPVKMLNEFDPSRPDKPPRVYNCFQGQREQMPDLEWQHILASDTFPVDVTHITVGKLHPGTNICQQKRLVYSAVGSLRGNNKKRSASPSDDEPLAKRQKVDGDLQEKDSVTIQFYAGEDLIAFITIVPGPPPEVPGLASIATPAPTAAQHAIESVIKFAQKQGTHVQQDVWDTLQSQYKISSSVYHITQVCVRPEYRGRNLGKFAVTTAIRWVLYASSTDEEGRVPVTLYVDTVHQGLFRTSGFQIFGAPAKDDHGNIIVRMKHSRIDNPPI